MMWCEKHAEMFKINGAEPDLILESLIKSLAAAWKKRPGMPTDRSSIVMKIAQMGNGKPFCCHLGEQKLMAILVSVATNVEKKKASNVDNG